MSKGRVRCYSAEEDFAGIVGKQRTREGLPKEKITPHTTQQ